MSKHTLKSEILELTEKDNIKCAFIKSYCDKKLQHDQGWGELEIPEIIFLPIDHDEKRLQIFLDDVDFEYEKLFYRQYIEGTIWLKDGTWLERRVCDDYEWWEHITFPEIHEICK